MALMSSWERQGMEQGAHQGKEEVLGLLLEQRFSTLPPDITAAIDRLTSDQLTELARVLLSLTSLGDLQRWLAEQAPAAEG